MPCRDISVVEDRENDKLGRTDGYMLLAALFWSVNLPAIKIALREFTPHGFNGPRLALASLLLLLVLWRKREKTALCRSDVLRIVVLGIMGNTFYQLVYINGVSRASALNTTMIMAMTPIFIALLSAAFLGERIHLAGWAGIFISFFGLYLILSGGRSFSGLPDGDLKGQLFILLGDLLWASYTVFSKPLLKKISPLQLTTLTLAVGTLFYLLLTMKNVAVLQPRTLSSTSWAALVYSSVFALAVSYVIWYSSVRRVGNTKTGIYGNITAVFTIFFAHLFLSETMTVSRAAGMLAIFVGFTLTRVGCRWIQRRG